MSATPQTDSPLTPDRIPRLARGVRLQWEAVPQVWILLYPEGRVELNPSAAEIMQRVNDRLSIRDIADELQQAFNESDLLEDVTASIQLALAQGWVEVRGAQ